MMFYHSHWYRNQTPEKTETGKPATRRPKYPLHALHQNHTALADRPIFSSFTAEFPNLHISIPITTDNSHLLHKNKNQKILASRCQPHETPASVICPSLGSLPFSRALGSQPLDLLGNLLVIDFSPLQLAILAFFPCYF